MNLARIADPVFLKAVGNEEKRSCCDEAVEHART
jgi:hypothetical protein